MKKKSRNMVRGIILIASALALLMAGLVGYIGYRHIQEAYYTSLSEGLHAAAVLLDDEVSHQFEGDWHLSEDGELMKGEIAVHDIYQGQLDALSAKTNMHFTIFYGDTRFVTSLKDADTGLRMEGTKASDAVVAEVIAKGNEYLATNFEIAGQDWYAYYLPLKNTDGTVAGMIFAGRDTSIVVDNLRAAGRAIIFTFLGFFLRLNNIWHFLRQKRNV